MFRVRCDETGRILCPEPRDMVEVCRPLGKDWRVVEVIDVDPSRGFWVGPCDSWPGWRNPGTRKWRTLAGYGKTWSYPGARLGGFVIRVGEESAWAEFCSMGNIFP